MSTELDQRCRDLVVELGLGAASDVSEVRPLTGGVASDIAMVVLPDQKICVKFALPKLRVAADWQAPVHRNAAEYAWLKVAADILPDSSVRLYGRSETAHGFAMEFLDGQGVYLWKDALLAEAKDRGEAARVADMLGQIHKASAANGFDTSAFQNRDDFRALRIEPYLGYTAQNHPDLAAILGALEEMLYDGNAVLVHGDVSPKNILFRDDVPLVLDAECATMGDASFDPSFCLNHLVLKAIHLPGSSDSLLTQVQAFWAAYATHITWEAPADLEARICRLLPALMLARVDGKSPVEYLDEAGRETVRRVAIPLIKSPVTTVADFADNIAIALKEIRS
ncbi:phosphotransferase family protein [Cognatishimia maritima]|uniref:Predicted kinase, aminoglycoside phosphotransferase (APT) family n=1 Tax=Cognatishimia maritima TaxID=870908 RepID=A0A1M5QXY1_9RHOB|nr:aminoglycoside phosphotransferase family protein [Cognatishimia maritima]SHH18549.1 Predicted kinase, aminoglycoside phosphotransferase (APT) family [Cognatishimia maritima]